MVISDMLERKMRIMRAKHLGESDSSEIIKGIVYPFEEKTTEQLIKECNEANRNSKELPHEDAMMAEIEDDAEGGYRPETDDDED